MWFPNGALEGGCEVTRGHDFEGEVEVTHFWICEVTQNRFSICEVNPSSRSRPLGRYLRGHTLNTSISARSSQNPLVDSNLFLSFRREWLTWLLFTLAALSYSNITSWCTPHKCHNSHKYHKTPINVQKLPISVANSHKCHKTSHKRRNRKCHNKNKN